MDSLSNDHRFSRAFTDPRFRPMPTLQKKVKIDNRFKAVLSSKDYGHRVLLDKRGRPIHDISKRGKHEMERYYQISSDDSSSSGEEEESESETEAENYTKLPSELTESEADSDTPVAKTSIKKRKNKDSASNKKSTKRKGDADNEDDTTTTTKKKAKDKVKAAELKPSRKKRSLDDQEAEEENAIEKSPAAKRLKKQTEVKSAKTKLNKKSSLVDEEEEKRGKNKSNQKFTSKQFKMKEQIVSDDDDGEDEEDSDEEEKDLSSSSDSDDSSNEEDGEESGEEIDTSQCVPIMRKSTSVDHSWNELHRKAPIVSESTHRLAVCNMDWDFVKAQDLFVLFKSFVGEGGSVRSVTIYPSEFGKERMAEDATYGPREMRGDLNGLDSEGDSEESESEEAKRKKNRRIDSEILKRKAKEAAKAQNEVLRGYQLNRLRYYFAVVDCNSVEAADAIYKECDGMEYQLSSLRLDLRYIPDDMTFDDPPKDSFSDEQGLVDFKPNYFLATALSQGKVNVTWDETEFDRIRNKITNAQREELEQIVEENRYADTIAPPESDSDFEDDERPQWLKTALGGESNDDDDNSEAISEEKKISLYRKVLMDKLVEDEEKEEKKTEIDKEMEWTAGLKTDYESKLKRREKIKEESQGVIVDKYLERKREKRRKRLQKKAELAKAEGGSDGDDNDGEDHSDNDMPDIIDDSLKEMMASEGHDVNSIKSKKKTKPDKKKAVKKKEEDDSEAERERAELELLLMRDDDEKKLEKPEVVKNKLSRRQKKKISMQKSERRKQRKEGRLTLDVEDQRFGAMFTSHHFHIDPNHGQFRKTKNNMKLLDEQIKRMSKAKKDNAGKNVEGQLDRDEDSRSVSKKLVESLKSKMKK